MRPDGRLVKRGSSDAYDVPHLSDSLGSPKNENPSGDFTKAARCGAKNRRGSPCQQPAMKMAAAGSIGAKAPARGVSQRDGSASHKPT